jgi:hypothetical protein
MKSTLTLAFLLVPVVAVAAAPARKGPAKPRAQAPAKSAAKARPAEKPKPVEPQALNLGGVVTTVPGEWITQPPTSEFRLAQYAVPKAAGDPVAPLFLVFHFGKGGGGNVEDNVKRWMSLMEQPAGTDIRTVMKRATKERPGLRITTVELPGTFQDKPFPRSTEITPRPNYRMLAAIVETTNEGGDGPFYLRIVGPNKSVEAAKAGWDQIIESLKTQ